MKTITFKSIKKIICEGQNVSPDVVFQKTRKGEIVFARQLIMYFSRKYLKWSLAKTGCVCGKKDHATVLHAQRSINNYIYFCPEKKKMIKEYNSKICIGADYEEDAEYKETAIILKNKEDIDLLKTENKRLESVIANLESEIRSLKFQLSLQKERRHETVFAFSGYREHAR